MASKWRSDDYKYLALVDAVVALNQRVNLIAVVFETSFPKKSRGTDFFCTLSIVDESRLNPGISVNFFADNMGQLPQVECNGDIIQLSSVVMKTHGSEVYALFSKKYSSFALYKGKVGASFVPYQASFKFRAREKDKKLITDLRQWSDDKQLDSGVDDSVTLKDIREDESFNLVCKVLHICEVSKDERILFVWDGTDTPVTKQMMQKDKMEDSLPLHLESSCLPLDVLRMFPTVGTVLRVFIDSANEKLGLHVLKIGRWVKIMKMRFEIRKGLWHGVLMHFTKLRCLVDNNRHVLTRQRNYDERIESKFGRMPSTSFPWPSHITETDYPDVPFCTLMDVLAYPEVTASFKCVVRTIEVYPWRTEEFRSPIGTYRIRLTLEDPTARIYAFVYAQDGKYFWGDFQSIDILTKKRNMLLGISGCGYGNELKNAPRDAPWVQCCIKSYYLDKNNMWESRRYQIFGTRLINEL